MQVGMQGSATPASYLLDPPKPGEYRVGALGSQLGQLSAKTLAKLFPLALQQMQQRQDEDSFAKSLEGLDPTQRQHAILARQHPEIYREMLAQQQASAKESGYQRDVTREDALRADQRSYAEGVNERELREAALGREAQGAKEIDVYKQKLALENEQKKKELELHKQETQKKVDELMAQAKSLDPKFREWAGQMGVTLPQGDVQVLSAKNKAKLAQVTGVEPQDVVAQEDLDELANKYTAFHIGSDRFGQPQTQPEQRAPLPYPMRAPDGTDSVQISPERVIDKSPESRKKFEDLVKMFKGDVGKAYTQMVADEKDAIQNRRSTDIEVRGTARQRELEQRGMLGDIAKAKAQYAAAQAKLAKADPDDSKTKATATGEVEAAKAEFEAQSRLFKDYFGTEVPDYLKLDGAAETAQPAKATGNVMENPRVKELMALNETTGLTDAQLAELKQLSGK